jgi:hypothetical protein
LSRTTSNTHVSPAPIRVTNFPFEKKKSSSDLPQKHSPLYNISLSNPLNNMQFSIVPSELSFVNILPVSAANDC